MFLLSSICCYCAYYLLFQLIQSSVSPYKVEFWSMCMFYYWFYIVSYYTSILRKSIFFLFFLSCSFYAKEAYQLNWIFKYNGWHFLAKAALPLSRIISRPPCLCWYHTSVISLTTLVFIYFWIMPFRKEEGYNSTCIKRNCNLDYSFSDAKLGQMDCNEVLRLI